MTRTTLRTLVACLCVILAIACGVEGGERALHEGSVDACALLAQDDVRSALGAESLKIDKGVIAQTWASTCRWSAEGGDAFLSVVAHTKNGEKTFRALRYHLPNVKLRADLHSGAYQSGNKLFLFKRGVYVTIDSSAQSAVVDPLAKKLLAALDELAKQQEVHR